MTQLKRMTDENLQTAYLIIAGIVKKHGDVYLPIFKRVHEEVELRKKQNDLLLLAMKIAE
ncbi:hypothetical protein CAP35_04680 [Chitinophagaceae bacterium IBVUCB1]|nr:hypothetical protein CAP35_04680 [Chitinophagaceae bacterium IBVUCB1]